MTERECILYARISDAYRQGDGYSIDAQIGEGSKYANNLGLEISRFFIEKESAKDSGRPVFNDILAYVKKQKKPIVLLVEKTDRLYRNSMDKYLVEQLIKSHELEVHLFKESEVLQKGMSSHKKQIHGFKAFMAECYIDNLREEALKGTRQKLLNGGWPSRAPYGYKNEKKQIIVDPERVDFVRAVFGLYASGLYSLDRLAEKLIEDGYVYKSTQIKIHRASLDQMLKNPFYIGEMAYQGEVYTGSHQAIIDKSTWLQVQDALRHDGKPISYRKNSFKYKGLMICVQCGSSVVGEHKKGGKYTYYRCAANTRGCEQGYVNETVLDEQFAAIIRSINVPPEARTEILEAVAAMDELAESTMSEELMLASQKLQAAQKRRRRIYQDHLSDLIEEDLYQQASQDVLEEIRILQARFEKLSEADTPIHDIAKGLLELPATLTRRWIASNDAQRQKLLKGLCSNYILDGQNISYTLKEPFCLLGKSALESKWWAEQNKARTLLMLHSETIEAMSRILAA